MLELTLTQPPTWYGATHSFGVQPWRSDTFKFSTDPELEGKIPDVVGLYLHPPEKAVVLCVDEKPQVQVLKRSAPTLPVRPGQPERTTFDYVRHGTTTLFAALEVATGKVTDTCTPRHRHQEFLSFLKQVAAAYPRRQLHVVVDNYATHKHPAVRAWLKRHPRITLHFTPTLRLAAEPGGGVLLHPHPPGAAPRQLPASRRPDRRDQTVHRRLERPVHTLHLDQGPRHRHRQGHRSTAAQHSNQISYGALVIAAGLHA